MALTLRYHMGFIKAKSFGNNWGIHSPSWFIVGQKIEQSVGVDIMNKRKILVGVLALLSGHALAATSPSTTGNGELFLTVYDPVAKVSYMRDLGISLNDFLPTSTQAGNNLTFNADANWGTFMSQVSASDVLWDVKAADSIGSGFGGHRYLSTSTAPLSLVDDITNAKVVQLKQVDDFINANNNLLSPPANTDYAAAISTIAHETDSNAYAGVSVGDKWKGQSNFASVSTLGTAMEFFYLTPSSTSGLAKGSVTQYGNTFGNSTWTLGADGKLIYLTAAPAVPEAETYAMFGIGCLAVAGYVRRRNAKRGIA
jgi:hypothetical protein